MLTRAQLLTGNSSQGVVLAGQTQGVRQGVGVIIAADGTISFDSVTATGIVKTNNPTAYNAYVWPTTLGVAGQQLQLGAAGALSWEDPDQIPWTAKGELIVGTGLNTSTILSVGVDGSILIADSTQASGLGYTTNFVATTGATSAANLPAGATGLRPVTPSTGAFRYNSTTTSLEFYNGSSWETVASSSTNSFVEQTSTTGAAVMPAGTQLQRPGGPAGGFFRFNDDTDHMEFWNGTSWQEVASGNSPTAPVPATIVSSVTGTLPITVATGTSTPVIAINAATTSLPGSVQLADAAASQGGTSATLASTPAFSVPKDASGMTGSAYLPAGTTAQRPAAGNYTGQFRYNTTIPQLEYSDGAAWQPVSSSSILPASLAEAQAGTITTKYSSPQTAVPKDASGMTGSAYIPAGTTAQRPTVSNYTGQFRYNTTIPQLEYSDGTTWLGLGGLAAATLTQAQAGTLATVAATPQTAVPKDASGMTGSAYLPAGTTAQRPTASNYTGQLRYNTQIPQWEYSDGASWLPFGGSVLPASLAEAAAGTINTKFNSPETSVPKDAAGMTGAAILPSGTSAQRAAITSLVTGMQRYNTDTGFQEVYTGSTNGWKNLDWQSSGGTSPDLIISANGPLPSSGTYRNITINAGVTATAEGIVELTATDDISIQGNITGVGFGVQGSIAVSGVSFAPGIVDTWGQPGQGLGGGRVDLTVSPVVNYGGQAYSFSVLSGSSGGNGRTQLGGDGSSGSGGGSAGASLVLRAGRNITQGGASVINMSGGDGRTNISNPVGTYSTGGGGGGSGGIVVLQGNNITVSGSLVAAGGNGSNGVAVTGGGGGGGGYIILNTRGTLIDGSTKNVSGGVGGTFSLGPPVTGGGIGGSFGGIGGVEGGNGSSGQTLFNNFI